MNILPLIEKYDFRNLRIFFLLNYLRARYDKTI